MKLTEHINNSHLYHIVRYCVFSWSLVCALVILLTSCGGGNIYIPSQGLTDDSQALSISLRPVAELLYEAEHSLSPIKEQLQIQAIEQLWSKKHYDRALDLLLQIDPRQLQQRFLAIYSLLYGGWAVDNQQLLLAETLLINPQLEQLLGGILDPKLTASLHQLRAEYFTQIADFSRALEERIALDFFLLEVEQQAENHRLIWWLTRSLSASTLSNLLSDNTQNPLQGWLELAQIASLQNVALEQQFSLLNQWLLRWPQHSTIHDLPKEIQALQLSAEQRPRHITLLLPLTGPLAKTGKAIRDGFLAAFYQAQLQNSITPKIKIIDSAQTANFENLYTQIASTDTDLIIGPLAKESANLLSHHSHLPIPTLALNYPETFDDEKKYDSSEVNNTVMVGPIFTGPRAAPVNLYYFGLNPEDEAKQAAQQAFKNKHKNVLIIAPDSNRGRRVSNAFLDQWQKQGGEALNSAFLNSKNTNYSKIIQQALGVKASKNRKNRVQQLTHEPIEFEPRRRQDIDVIFLASHSQQARQIKPLLAFHYAGQIPVYATSSIYTGKDDPEKDTDLNGIYFSVMPWLLSSNKLKSDIDHYLAPNPLLQPLFAMGSDAWRLHDRLPLLASSIKSKISGNTGTLNLNAQNKIYRQQPLVTIQRGHIKVLSDSP